MKFPSRRTSLCFGGVAIALLSLGAIGVTPATAANHFSRATQGANGRIHPEVIAAET